MAARPARTFRLQCSPEHVPAVEALLAAEGYGWEMDPAMPLARRLTHEPRSLGESLAARFGYLYIQDRSSMVPPLVLAPPNGAVVLDICASPGSKSSLLAHLVGPGGLVVANEPSRDRLATLRQNLRRLSLPQVVSSGHEGQNLPLAPGVWPHILLDPPCSGWGTADKHPQVLRLWSADKVAPLLALQRRLLAQAATLLAPGGRLVYSTCTTNVQENADQTAWAVASLGLTAEAPALPPGFVASADDDPRLGRTIDGEASGGQGFFVAVLTKPEGQEVAPTPNPALPGHLLEPTRLDHAPDLPLAWDQLPAGSVRDFGGRVHFLPAAVSRLSPELRWQGLPLGKISGRTFRPDARARALLPAWSGGQGLNLTDPSLLHRLLAGVSLELPASGLGLYFQGLPLGFLSRKGRRLLWSDRGSA